MLVAQILKVKGSEVVQIERHRSIRDAAELMEKHRIGAVMVTGTDGICGILSERDIARGLAEYGGRVAEAAVDSMMTRELVCCMPNDPTDQIMTLMTERRIRHLPVMADGALLGMISIGDIVKARLSELESQSEAMQTYIAGMA